MSFTQLDQTLVSAVEEIVTASAKRLFAGIVEDSPVVSGAFRAGNRLGSKAAQRPDPEPVPGRTEAQRAANATERAMQNGRAYRYRLGDGQVVFSNPVAHAPLVEAGASDQAPAGVYSLAAEEFPLVLRDEAARKGVFK